MWKAERSNKRNWSREEKNVRGWKEVERGKNVTSLEKKSEHGIRRKRVWGCALVVRKIQRLNSCGDRNKEEKDPLLEKKKEIYPWGN